MRALAALLAMLLATAGCQGLSPDGPSTTPTPTVSPVPVPTDRPGDTGVPGVTVDRDALGGWAPDGDGARVTVDGATLVAGHERALADRSVTVRTVRRLEAANGTALVDFERTTRAGADRSRVLRTTAADARGRPSVRADLFADGDGVAQRLRRDGHERLRRLPSDSVNGSAVVAGYLGRVEPLFAAASEVRARRVASTRSPRLRLTVTAFDRERLAASLPVESVERARAVVALAPDGRIISSSLTYVGRRGDGRARGVEEVSYETVGVTTVPRPDWVARALATATPTTAGPTPAG